MFSYVVIKTPNLKIESSYINTDINPSTPSIYLFSDAPQANCTLIEKINPIILVTSLYCFEGFSNVGVHITAPRINSLNKIMLKSAINFLENFGITNHIPKINSNLQHFLCTLTGLPQDSHLKPTCTTFHHCHKLLTPPKPTTTIALI